MHSRVVREDEDVVEVYDDIDVEQVREERIQESLESGRSVGKTFRNDPELEGTVTGPESGLRLIARSDSEKVVSVTQVKFGIDTRLPGSIEEIRDEGKRIPVFPSDPVKTPIVDAKPEGTVLFLGEEDRSSMTRTRRVYETSLQVLVDELLQGGELGLRKGIYMADRRDFAFSDFDLEIEFPMRRKVVRFLLGEDVSEVVVFRRETGNVRRIDRSTPAMKTIGSNSAQGILDGRLVLNDCVVCLSRNKRHQRRGRKGTWTGSVRNVHRRTRSVHRRTGKRR